MLRAKPLYGWCMFASFWLAAIQFLAGCGSVSRGEIRSMPERVGCRVVGDAPIAGASVALVCPDVQRVRWEVFTDSDGHFFADSPDRLPFDCHLRIAARGYVPRRVPVTDFCVDTWGGGGCLTLVGLVRLVRKEVAE